MSDVDVCVLGDTTMGVALAYVAATANGRSRLWCRDSRTAEAVQERRQQRFFPDLRLPDGLVATSDMAEAVRGSQLVIVAIPSSSFGGVVDSLARIIMPSQVVFSSTKGVSPVEAKTMTQVLRDRVAVERFGSLGGANITTDIVAQQLTSIVAASSSVDARMLVKRALETPFFRVETSADLEGIELVSVFKNVAAIATGIATGLGAPGNTVSLVLAQAYAEVQRVVLRLGAGTESLLGPCLADLFLTCTHPASLNRRLGMELGQGRQLDAILREMHEVPEGVSSVHAFCEMAASVGVETPIARHVRAILRGEVQPATLLARVGSAIPSNELPRPAMGGEADALAL